MDVEDIIYANCLCKFYTTRSDPIRSHHPFSSGEIYSSLSSFSRVTSRLNQSLIVFPLSFQPKTRPSAVIPSKYASLPSGSPPRIFGQASGDSGIGCSDDANNGLGSGRNVLGMGISAVHDAVLRGFAKIPGKCPAL